MSPHLTARTRLAKATSAAALAKAACDLITTARADADEALPDDHPALRALHDAQIAAARARELLLTTIRRMPA